MRALHPPKGTEDPHLNSWDSERLTLYPRHQTFCSKHDWELASHPTSCLAQCYPKCGNCCPLPMSLTFFRFNSNVTSFSMWTLEITTTPQLLSQLYSSLQHLVLSAYLIPCLLPGSPLECKLQEGWDFSLGSLLYPQHLL